MALKELRKEKGILAKKVAECLGISYRQYHRIELGEVKVNSLKLEILSQIYGINGKQIEKNIEEGGTDNV
ncbi:helix-turn-helix domain-containing protein [Clostridium tagluense]|uniref:HTH cro/C1-type domain-containing protein n=1 Tax=Clostridium tagluense TaxID=360422 RepID=A0A401UU20_9CLOT|nr:helix-turn-helix transcriptional regulator [Clostridium tagluense]GCD13045.1 hypothetical protein Ctaglu_46680 [Clostridium tagluense]